MPRPIQVPSTPTTSTTLPGLGRCAGLSTSFWKIHGWLPRQALRRWTVGMGSFMRALSRSGWVDQRRAEGPRSCMDTLAGFTRNRLAAIHGATVPAPDRPARPSLAGRSAGHAAVPRERPASPPRCETAGAAGGDGCAAQCEAAALYLVHGFAAAHGRAEERTPELHASARLSDDHSCVTNKLNKH